jgi:hypothetical protein
MELEERLRDAYEQLPVPGPDELNAFGRFRRRPAQRPRWPEGSGCWPWPRPSP